MPADYTAGLLPSLAVHAVEDVKESVLHNFVPSSQHSPQLNPTGGYVHHLDGADVFTGSSGATVMDQVDFEVSRFLDIPGDRACRDVLKERAFRAGSL